MLIANQTGQLGLSEPHNCTVSIVVFNTPNDLLHDACSSLLRSSYGIELHVVDNSASPGIRKIIEGFTANYHFTGANIGYGKAHNLALSKAGLSKYHLIMNPDILVGSETIEKLAEYMDNNHDVGAVSPKIVHRDGTLQPLNKRFPSVLDLLIRRLLPARFKKIFRNRLDRYEMKDTGYNAICDVEVMTGCFMFCRNDVIKAVGGFDNRYFLYFEDVDLSRKIQQAGYRTVYYPDTSVVHDWQRASYKSLKMTLIHMWSAIKYFNKWGWKFY